MAEKSAGAILSSTIEKIRDLVDTSTIIGEAIYAEGGTTIIPVSRVACGFGAGGSEFSAKPSDKKKEGLMFGGGCGGGVSVNPVAFLVVKNDNIRLMPVSDSMSTIDRIVDMVPEVINKFNNFIIDIKDKKSEEEK